jgi:hypothetical protein
MARRLGDPLALDPDVGQSPAEIREAKARLARALADATGAGGRFPPIKPDF